VALHRQRGDDCLAAMLRLEAGFISGLADEIDPNLRSVNGIGF